MSVTHARLELVLERNPDLELTTAETLSPTQKELLWYNMMYENIPCVYLSLDTSGKILSVNQFGAACLGFVPKKLLHLSIFELFAPTEQQRLADALKDLLNSSEQFTNGEFRLNCPMSTIIWVNVVARVLQSEEPPTIIMVCFDITAHKQAFDSTESLNRLKEKFLSTVSHELRTPLTNMKMAIQMLLIALKQEQTNTEAEWRRRERYLEILNNECDREINLINNFLDLQRLDTSSQPMVLETIQLQQWLRRVVEIFNARSRRYYEHELQLNVASDLPPLVCDPFSLERILLELLNNASKFSPEGEKIILTAQLNLDKIQLKVTNTGVEIPQADLPRIFDKFYRVPSNDPWKQGGTGLGLALVKKLTQHLGGTIEVHSESKITQFTIILPVT